MDFAKDRWVLAGLGAVVVLLVAEACGSSDAKEAPTAAPRTGDAAAAACPPCVTDDDCGGGTCVQIGADSICAPACTGTKQIDCASDRKCVPATTITGDQVSVCVPKDNACDDGSEGTDEDAGPPLAGDCPGLAAPDAGAACKSCGTQSNCQANGCYGGWWCNLGTSKCQPPPTRCGSDRGAFDGGAAPTGSVGPGGGKLSRLYFAVVGDTRPPAIDDTAGYPTKVITQIFTSIQNLSPRPVFVVSSGDYMFARPSGTQAASQLDLYLAARADFTGTLFPAMGNHECTGATASNCGPGTTTGTTSNMSAFVSKMLAAVQRDKPYYSVHIDAEDGSWTSKFVVVAANAWTNDQATWLDGELSNPTTYTFLVRHESHAATEAPGVRPAEQIMAKHPYTLSIVGHTHTYAHVAGSREVIIGNGGAPLTGGKNYGFGVLQQRPDGAIQVDMLDYETNAPDLGFRFAVKPDGSTTP